MTGDPTPPLAALRAEIDALDRALVALIAQRVAVTARIRAFKDRQGIPRHDAERERAVLEAVRAEATRQGVAPDLAEAVLRTILDAGR